MDLKKDFLKDTINNVVSEIDKLRETKYSNYKKNIESRDRRFEEELGSSDNEFIYFFINKFND